MEKSFQSTPQSAAVVLEAVTKRFGALVAVDDVSLEIRPGEFFSLLGPSGCGKTTLLRIIAGFEQPDAGRVVIGGKDMTRATPNQRPTAMVFQSYALFPTMTVAENVAYGLAVRKMTREAQRQQVAQALARVDLSGSEDKPVTQLSGGQQQRVALARALAVAPDILLFDEPLSNLDVALREQTRAELKVLQKQLGTTSIYVTHDQQEALALSDRMVVMKKGRLQQIGPPEALYQKPQTAFVANFLGGSNLITQKNVAQKLAAEAAPEGHILSIRPEHIRLSPQGSFDFRFVSQLFLGTYSEWRIEVEGVPLKVWADPALKPEEALRGEILQHRWVQEDREISHG